MTSAASGAAAPRPVPLLQVRDLGIRHDGSATATPASATFSVARGEVVLLLGPSGAGKSTLALALNGLIPHAVPATIDGTVLVDGLDTRTTPVATLSTHVGMVFQDPDAQLVTGTLLDEVAFGPENLRMPVDEVLARSEDALRRVGLWDRRHENPDRLSGGGRQRLAIACALAMGSPLLVLDEPTANLDPQGIDEVYAALGDLVAAGDRAIVLVEHNLDAATAITDRVVVLDHDGHTVADGTVDDVLRGRADELHAMGVWLPVATIAALRLRAAGWSLDPLPLDPAELRAGLEAAEAPASAVRNSVSTPFSGPQDPISADSAASRLNTEHTAAATEPLIRVRGLRTRRGRTEVLHGVDLDVAAGEFVAIVGANGAGKTTLLQSIAGVVRVPRGQVRVDGVDVARIDLRSLSRRIGFVFQNPEHQFIAHTVFDELAHGLRLQKLPADEVRERTLEVLRRFGLEDKADVHPFLLSGGQKRRLSVGTALVAGAPVLALDEPTFGQDRARADELMHLLRGLSEAGTTILVVTHDMQLVTEYAHRTIVVGDGTILADAPTSEIFADEALLQAAGLRQPPLRRAFAGLTRHPSLAGVTRLADLPHSAARVADVHTEGAS
ncbi:MAG: ABC transporter ATP-binding protein [Microbacterium sp. SCN 70-200]|uniref:ABC transporter ATP-binding protein n=1 Tax=unclassified Microbacterium TaxID=2609290 RepID=UPI00086A4E3E|nr:MULTISPECIES: ABC transporter ATP-binding protein [unclassified Microbacterium]MBN9215252.1 energy-coupling factor ABC transporter ATP-binding protein [Microbacterium sp.]ODT42661.1 MAG: ABC transporter ATP-binding protein [Microbacterium sp. SCN 70-200]OJV79996.1 MAG: ABC transporter ATP-binding protein [Microbacterium sp. 70-16]